jgi:hypothetical protein
MHPRTRKLIGAILLLFFLITYVLLAMAFAIVMQMDKANGAVVLAFYAVAGTIWVIPAGLIVQWMQQSPPEPN